MKLRRRIGSAFLALVMVLSLIPTVAVSALAADLDEPVYRIRLMNRENWQNATFARADISRDGYAAEQYLIFYDGENAYTTGDIALGANNSYSTEGYYDTEATGKSGKIVPNQIDRIAIGFTYKTQTVEAVFHRDEFSISYNEGTPGLDYAEISLTSPNVPSGNAVWFYAPLGTDVHNTLYDVVYTETNTSLGSNMPNNPPVSGDYVFISWWQEELNREFTADTIVKEDLVIYGEKVNQHNNPHFRVHNVDGDVYEKVAEKLNATPEDISITGMCLVGTGLDGEPTKGNPYYDGTVGGVVGPNANQWHDDNTWFSICNIDIPEAADQGWNLKVLPDTLQGIELYGTLNGEAFPAITLSRNELDLHVNNDTWVDVYLRDTPDSPNPDPGTPDLSVTKAVEIPGDKVTASVGDTLEYTITVTNSGDGVANDVTVWDSLWTDPNGSVQINGEGSYIPVAEGYCTVNVPANGTTTITYTYTVPENMAGNKLTNNVWIGENEGDPNTSNTVNVEELVPDTYPVIVYAVKNKDLSTKVEVSKENVSLGTQLINYLEALTLEDPGFVGYTAENTWYKYDSPDFCFTDTDIVNGWINVLVNYVPNKYTLVYHGNGGLTASEKDQSTSTVTYDSTATLKGNDTFTRDGYTFQGWATSKEGEVTYTGSQEVLINNERFPGLTDSGEAHLYAVWAKDAPTTEELNILFPNGVQVDCLSQNGHSNQDYDLADDTYITNVEWKDGQWTCNVTVTGQSYVAQYVDSIGWPHTANDNTRSVTLVWENGAWTKTKDNNVMVVFDVTCQAPKAPTYDQMKDLFKVQIDCITSDQWGDEYEHKNQDYSLIKDSYTQGDITANADGTWNLKVTVEAASYVDAYNQATNVSHTLSKEQNKTVTLVYKDNQWTTETDIVVFDVKCSTPNAPGGEEITDILDSKNAVKVICQSDEEHQTKDKIYAKLLPNEEGNVRYEIGAVTPAADGTFTCNITILPTVYVAQYNADTNLTHWLVDESDKAVIPLTWKDGVWTAPEQEGDTWATFEVTCLPEAPTYEDLTNDNDTGILDGKEAVEVICVDNQHDAQVFEELWENTDGKTRYKIGDVVRSEDGTITCDVTILPEVYVNQYNTDTKTDHWLTNDAPQTIPLTWNMEQKVWTAPTEWEKEAWATFEVSCAAITITPADIEIYTGGNGYNGVLVNKDGELLDQPTSGLPEPGYHIELPDAVNTWLEKQGIDTNSAEDLSPLLHFAYDQDA